MEYRRAFVPGGSFFFTLVPAGRKPVLADAEAVAVLRAAFRNVMAKRPSRIDAMVVLPDHLHCIWTLPPPDSDFATRWRLVKTWFTKHRGSGQRDETVGHASPAIAAGNLTRRTIASNHSRRRQGEQDVWQRRYWEHVVRDAEDFRHHVEFIHYDPVKHGHVACPIDWEFPSFETYAEAGLYARDWGKGGVDLPDRVGSE
jgi:putative transposase